MPRKQSNWGTVSARRLRAATTPRPDVRPPRPEVLPVVSAEELKRREESNSWLRCVLDAGDD